MNAELAARDQGYRVAVVEWVTDAESGEMGNTVFFNNRGNKQLGHDFVPGDPRRGGFLDIAWFNDTFDGATTSGLTTAQTAAAIRRAMSTWDNVQCSNIPLTDLGDIPVDLGFVQFLLGFGGFPAPLFDVTHAGFLGGPFFDALAPGGSGFILGVTFTFVFTDGMGGLSDIDNNKKLDTAFREIYYNDAFPWAINANFDVETVALHEAGHGLSQAHFGKLFSNKSGFHFAPQAVMNAGYTQVQQQLLGTDVGGHCSNWGEWPNN